MMFAQSTSFSSSLPRKFIENVMTTLSKWEYNAGAKARKNPMFTINTFAAVVSGTYQHVMI